MDPAVIAVCIPIVGMMIPIVRMLTHHQQKMAEILNAARTPSPEVESLRREMAEMKALLHQQVIALDSSTCTKGLNLQTTPQELEN